MARPGTIRIIGGRWRRRRLPVPQAPGLRPTPDRVRETLFNWLAPELPGARCADLFAGSGALGFEAASRGAQRVVMVESDPGVVAHLQRQAVALGAEGVEVVRADSLRWLDHPRGPFDVVFLDPPFATVSSGNLLQRVASSGCLSRGARVYVESAADPSGQDLPPGWCCLREQRAGRVHYRLVALQDEART